jgi:hypothetical protein
MLGATYWLYAALMDFTPRTLVAHTKEFVQALLSLGT